jgi:3-deoxy-D-arabino-heptulosonate 7-phosphate (DAHP) synthase
MTLDGLLSKAREKEARIWHLHDSAGRLLVVVGPCNFYDAIDTCATLRPNGRLIDMRVA